MQEFIGTLNLCALLSVSVGSKLEEVLRSINSLFSEEVKAKYKCTLICFADGVINFDTKTLYKIPNLNVLLYKSEESVGLGAALVEIESSVSLTNYDYVFRIDDDDFSFPERIQRSIKEIQKGKLDVVSFGALVLDAKTGFFKKVRCPSFDSSKSLLYMAFNSPLNHPAVCFNGRVFENSVYRKERYAQDYSMIIHLLEQGCKVKSIPEPQICHFYNKSNRSQIERICIEIKIRLGIIRNPKWPFIVRLLAVSFLVIFATHRLFNYAKQRIYSLSSSSR